MFFFFQAEDGIRDVAVTGVQTCALPICCPEGGTVLDPFGGSGTTGLVADRLKRSAVLIELRSEERRVGKECRSRGSPYP